MVSDKINNILIPNVTKFPKKQGKSTDQSNKNSDTSEFKKLLEGQIGEVKKDHGINLSVHAAKRINERNLGLDNEEFFKLRGAIEKLKMKGGQDSLVITKNAAYIVDVPNEKIVTAISKDSVEENVFTKIDSTIVLN